MPEKKTPAGSEPAGTGAETIAGGDTQRPEYTPPDDAIQEPGDTLSDLEAKYGSALTSPADVARAQIADVLTGDRDKRIFWTARELLAAQFPAPQWAVPGLLPAGLSILAGRPKIGKSWLALQIAVAVATGGIVLGEQVQQRKVLYLALEDSERRLQQRLAALRCPATDNLTTVTQFPTLLTSGGVHLTTMAKLEHYGLIVVDTLTRFAGQRRPDDEMQVALRLGEVQRYAQQESTAVLIVDHHRKPAASMADVIDDISGLTQKAGVIDAALGLYRQRGQRGAELKLTGRDLDDREMAVEFDKLLTCWQLLGDASDVRANTLQGEILAAIAEGFAGQASGSDLARYMGRDRSNVHKELAELLSKGKVKRVEGRTGKEVLYKLT